MFAAVHVHVSRVYVHPSAHPSAHMCARAFALTAHTFLWQPLGSTLGRSWLFAYCRFFELIFDSFDFVALFPWFGTVRVFAPPCPDSAPAHAIDIRFSHCSVPACFLALRSTEAPVQAPI